MITDLNLNIYMDNCGFDNVIFSWGHDEYLARTLHINKTYLPPEALYIIRYHSFYSWHTHLRSYGLKHLADYKDWYMLPHLNVFKKQICIPKHLIFLIILILNLFMMTSYINTYPKKC